MADERGNYRAFCKLRYARGEFSRSVGASELEFFTVPNQNKDISVDDSDSFINNNEYDNII